MCPRSNTTVVLDEGLYVVNTHKKVEGIFFPVKWQVNIHPEINCPSPAFLCVIFLHEIERYAVTNFLQSCESHNKGLTNALSSDTSDARRYFQPREHENDWK